jgi:hypothetical protein
VPELPDPRRDAPEHRRPDAPDRGEGMGERGEEARRLTPSSLPIPFGSVPFVAAHVPQE